MRRYKLAVEAFKEAEDKLDKNPDWQVYYYLGNRYHLVFLNHFIRLGDTINL